MPRRRAKLDAALREAGAVLERNKHHAVYRLPNGRIFVTSRSPSDKHAESQALRDLAVIAAGGIRKGQRPQ